MKSRLDETNHMRRLMGLPLLIEQGDYWGTSSSGPDASTLLKPSINKPKEVSDDFLSRNSPTQSDTFTPEKYNYQTQKNIDFSTDDKNRLEELNNDTGWDISIDNIVDIVSAIIDVIPGIGNLVSFVIDILHSISYFIRSKMGDDESKIENYVGGIITAGFAFIPTPAGNMASIAVKGGLKKILSHTPKQVYDIAVKLGLANPKIFLSKDSWKYGLLLLLKGLFKEDLENTLSDFITKVGNAVDSTIKSIIEYDGWETPEFSDYVFPTKYFTKEIGKKYFSEEITEGLEYIKNEVIPIMEELLDMAKEIGSEGLEELANELDK